MKKRYKFDLAEINFLLALKHCANDAGKNTIVQYAKEIGLDESIPHIYELIKRISNFRLFDPTMYPPNEKVNVSFSYKGQHEMHIVDQLSDNITSAQNLDLAGLRLKAYYHNCNISLNQGDARIFDYIRYGFG